MTGSFLQQEKAVGNGGAWAYGLFAALAAVPAVLNNWRPWEVVALVAVLAPAGAVAAWAGAWRAVHARRADLAELAALSSDESAARLLGRSLGPLGSHLSDKHAHEIWDVFTTAPSETKRALAHAVAGVVAETGSYQLAFAARKVHALARGFRAPVQPPTATTDEDVARAFGEALGRCSESMTTVSVRELTELFAALSRDARRGLVNALAGYAATAFLYDTDLDARVLALAHSFRDGAPLGPPDLQPALTP